MQAGGYQLFLHYLVVLNFLFGFAAAPVPRRRSLRALPPPLLQLLRRLQRLQRLPMRPRLPTRAVRVVRAVLPRKWTQATEPEPVAAGRARQRGVDVGGKQQHRRKQQQRHRHQLLQRHRR